MEFSGFICEGPRCTKGNGGSRTVVQWVPALVKDNPAALPDAFFRFIVAQPTYEEPSNGQNAQPVVRHFCSNACLRDFFGQDYVPPRSPREQAAVEQNNQAVDAKRAAELAGRQVQVVDIPAPAVSPVPPAILGDNREALPVAVATDEAVQSGGNA